MRFWTGILIVSILALAGQPGLTAEMSKEEYIREMSAVKSRFYEYMSRRKANDFDSIYPMFSSAYRSEISLEKFKEMPFETTMNLMAYYIQAIKLDGDRATVFFMEYAISPGVPTPSIRPNLLQHWVREGDQWYYDRDTAIATMDFSACGNTESGKDRGNPELMPTFKACGAAHPAGKSGPPAGTAPITTPACGK
ncbi:MAG TPA: hypothetical protein PLV45_00550 [bacterium]|nr:hypothetical protein [bacterium]